MGIVSYTKSKKISCQYCKNMYWQGKLIAHEKSCILNPVHIKYCAICHTPVNKRKAMTCSVVCSNKHTPRRPRNLKISDQTYRKICFSFHQKQCIICGEQNIVAVHHYDHNRNNNCPTNLVPMCLTHHQYVHSSFNHMVKDAMDLYVRKFAIRYAGELQNSPS